jgi:hypothetical protein
MEPNAIVGVDCKRVTHVRNFESGWGASLLRHDSAQDPSKD